MAASLSGIGGVPLPSNSGSKTRRRSNASKAGSDLAGNDDLTAITSVRGSRRVKEIAVDAMNADVVEEVAVAETVPAVAEGGNGNYLTKKLADEAVSKIKKLPLHLFNSNREDDKVGEDLKKKPQPAKRGLGSSFLGDVFRHPLFSAFTALIFAGLVMTYVAPFVGTREGNEDMHKFHESVQSLAKRFQFQIDSTENSLKVLKGEQIKFGDRIDRYESNINVELEKLSTRIDETKVSLDKNSIRLDSLEERMNKFDSKFDSSLEQAIANALPSVKKEIMELVDIVITEKSAQGLGDIITLDDVRKLARNLIEEEFEMRVDDVGLPDFALASGGAKILAHSEAVETKSLSFYKLGLASLLRQSKVHSSSLKVLQPCNGVPGECLPLKGTNGTVDIGLRTAIFPTDITLEHVSERISFDMSSAPRNFEVVGWLKKQNGVESPSEGVVLGSFLYKIKGRRVQTFRISEEGRKAAVNIIRLNVLSNHGSPSHTCIYRFRVHGNPFESQLAN